MGEVWLRILGPFELRLDGGEPIALGGLRQRAVLAILALHAGEVVATERIIDELWGEHPPSSPAHTIQVFVSRLRRALGPASGRLDTVAPGYRLAIDATEIDAARCQRLYSEARAATGAGHPADARTQLDQALALWRGAPLADFTYEPFAQGAIAQLEELRVSCREELVEAELALGQHEKVVHDLEALIAEHPLRERPRGQLMLALYRCGRQAEALEAYHRARHMLFEQLAIEPSPALRALEQAILEQDRSLAAPAPKRDPADRDVACAGASGPATTLTPQPGSRDAAYLTSEYAQSLAVPPRAAEGAFVGRADCLERLRLRWDESKAGRIGLVWLVGEAGIGKTRLASQFAEEVHRECGAAVYGRAELESLLPYQPLAEVLDHLVSHADPGFRMSVEQQLETLSRSFPNLRRYTRASGEIDDRETMRYQVFEAVVLLLVRRSLDRPLLVVLDDLQWADQPTLLLMRHMLRRAEGARLLVLGTFRPDKSKQPLTGFLADLRRERLYDRLNLVGLDEDGTRQLVADRAGIETTRAFIQRLHRQTDGNPFFIEETLRALIESGRADGAVVDDNALEELGVPEGVAQVITRRAEQLSTLAQELLSVASVIGPSFNLRFVEDVMRSERRDIDRQLDAAPADAIAEAADEAVAADLVLELPDQFEVFTFVHALVREVFYTSLQGGRRVRLHDRAARALERLAEHSRVNPAELAHHFLEAKPVAGAEPARRYAIAAGRRAAEAFAYEEAAEHLRRARDLCEADDEEERCDILLELGRVQWHMGDDEARTTFMEAAESAERRAAADQLARAAIGFGERYFENTYLGGSLYRDLLEKALAASPRADSARRAVLLSRLAVNLAFPTESERAQALAGEAVAMARRLGDERTLIATLIAHHITLLDVRHLEQRLALGEELRSIAGGHEELAAEAHSWRMFDLLGIGELEAARREHAELERLAEKLGQPLLRSLALGARGLWAELAGDDELAERCADESLRLAKLAHTGDAASSWGSQMFALRRRQGRLGELAPLAEAVVAAGGGRLGWVSALGVLRLETGDEARARALYDQEMAEGAAALPRGLFWLTRMSLLSELCAGLGEADGAGQLYAELLPYVGRNVVVSYCSFWGPVDGYLALLADAFGDKPLASRHASAAREQAAAMDAPLVVRELERRRQGVHVAS
ncbi:MAG: AAA family ATPase [Solirubrobacterales bacterium]|nr:AAA family ATPase [Solirubrobacterales bacterium]